MAYTRHGQHGGPRAPYGDFSGKEEATPTADVERPVQAVCRSSRLARATQQQLVAVHAARIRRSQP